jgi:TolB-like protein/predicted Ser/Thr protein kinase
MSVDESSPSVDEAKVVAGRYEVIGLLGVGGMGAVYKVHDRELDEVVALKMLKREIADSPGIVDRFRREVKLARRVTHPNVARTFDLGEHEGERFLTMEYVEGESLATRLARERQLPIAAVVEIASAICAGLEAAHAAGVVHRDLKPDNVLLGHDRVVITDFGIARAQDAGAKSRTAVPVGTPAYMAPEQVEASPEIDARADIYALGAMLFELLTGRLPFESESVFAIAAMRLTQPPPDPRVHRPDLPETVATLVMRCMARKPEDRPQRASEIASRLASLTLPAADALAKTGESRIVSIAPHDQTGALQKTVAVLPFRNAGPADDDYLVDGLTDDVIDALSMTPGLRVRPRGVVMQHKNAGDPRAIGRQLGVQVVVEGTMRTSADTIRVSARVLSVEDGFQIWAKRFDGTRSDVLRIGDEASREVAAALSSRTPTRAAIATDPVAIDLYLRGRHEYLKFWSTANERAIELLHAAHERSPQDPLITAAYAASLARQFGFGSANPIERNKTARQIAEEAVRMAPQLAEAHFALAQVKLHEPDLPGTAASLVRALSLSPLLPDAHQLRARLLSEVGSPRESIEAAHRAMQLEPRFSHLRFDVQARAHAMLGEWNLVDYGEPPTEVEAANLYWIMATRFTMWKRDPAAAKLLAERLTALDAGSVLARMFVGWIFDKKIPTPERARLDERKAAEGITRRMRVFWNQLGAEMRIYVGEKPMDDVRRAVDLGLVDIAWMDGCPLLDDLRNEPGFAEMRETVATRARIVYMQLSGGEATLVG